ncbi:MAG TPA: Crp/Fnr family transcriptional regulator [Clostridia bacterium]|nr:Crp/Fnr family transcriptional regulator [Clostridia bacterium]
MNVSEELRKSPWLTKEILGEISPQDLAFIHSIGLPLKVKKNEAIFCPGDNNNQLIFLEKGTVKYLIYSKNGEIGTICYISDGCLLGEASYFHSHPLTARAIAFTDLNLISIGEEHMNEILSRPSLMKSIITSLSIKFDMLLGQIEDASFRNHAQKICRALYCLCKTQNTNNIAITHQELADITNTHRVTVTKTLLKLKKEGIISFPNKRRLKIIDWEGLYTYGDDAS